jgi:hypothetical protein
MKIRPVGTELFHVDGRTDMKLIVASRNFANAPTTGCITGVRNADAVLLLLHINWLHGSSFRMVKQLTAFFATFTNCNICALSPAILINSTPFPRISCSAGLPLSGRSRLDLLWVFCPVDAEMSLPVPVLVWFSWIFVTIYFEAKV